MSTGGTSLDFTGIGSGVLTAFLGAAASALWVRLRDTVFCSFKLGACWVVDKLFLFLFTPVQFVLDLIPDFPENWIIDGGEVLYCLNLWFPLAESLGLEIVIWTVFGSWVVVRLVKMFIWGASN